MATDEHGMPMPKPDSKQLVYLGNDMTQITLTEADKVRALNAAAWIFASPHEWTWSHEDQVAMARFVTWAAQKINIISYVANAENITRGRTKGGGK